MSDLLAMQRAVWRSGRPTTEKIVLLAIIDYYSEASPNPWPSVATIAAQTSLGRTAVLDAIAALDRDGVVVVTREFGRPNRYDLSHVCAALAPVRQADQSAMRTGEKTAESRASASPPVRVAHQSATRTGTPDGRDQSAKRTGPVRLADTKEPMKEPKKEASRAPARPPAGFDEALALPVAERAKHVFERPREAERLRPQQWPEVQKITAAFASAVGRERRLSEFARDSGLRAIVALLAAGNSVEDVAWVAGNVPRQAWWRSEGRTRGLATLSPEVAARALEERDGARRAGESSEERRLRRNALLSNAEAGRYGAEVRRRAQSGVGLRLLADELERRERLGDLGVRSSAGAAEEELVAQHPGLAKSAGPRELNAPRCLATLLATLDDDSPRPREGECGDLGVPRARGAGN